MFYPLSNRRRTSREHPKLDPMPLLPTLHKQYPCVQLPEKGLILKHQVEVDDQTSSSLHLRKEKLQKHDVHDHLL